MNLLKYKYIRDGLLSKKPMFLLCKIEKCGDDDEIIISVPGFDGAKVLIGKSIFKIADGKCTIKRDIKISKSESETIVPKLIYEGKSYKLSPFVKEGSFIKKTDSDEGYIELLIDMLLAAEKRLFDIEKRLSEIESQVIRKELFTFL